MKQYVLLLLIAATLISFDQLSKRHVERTLRTHHNAQNLNDYRGRHISVIKNFFSIRYVRNPGAAWGIGSNINDQYRDPFFITMTLISMLFILFYFKTTRTYEYGIRLCLTLVLAGALGNFIDRLRLTYVIDFLDFSFGGWHFPAFNIADAAISVGVFILMLLFIFDELKHYNREKKTSSSKENL